MKLRIFLICKIPLSLLCYNSVVTTASVLTNVSDGVRVTGVVRVTACALQPCQARWGHWSSTNQWKRQIISEKQNKKVSSVWTPGWVTRTSNCPSSVHSTPVRRRPWVWRAKSSPARCSPNYHWQVQSGLQFPPQGHVTDCQNCVKSLSRNWAPFWLAMDHSFLPPASHPSGRSDFLGTIVSTVKEPKRGASISPYLSHKNTKARTYKMSKKGIHEAIS